ncbi:Aldehyde Dehydrogenase [Pseudodesulfovibrio mercurii]|uniref:Aldehyde Dehydrogenase n=1 Tax=Pseudodesulfovibrio mercurii TaxID=641491 RepID=F0JC01_9BACT|nr:NAD-dependent succinate-semialdehyde dehydrogenase [Pseudodesulfovibrio mercurii]EGB14394.1 Aldehyde Dehydrogenase [Pseudodesulfovibrio mercurii]
MPLQSTNPLTGKVTRQFDEFTPEQTAAAVREVAGGYATWKTTDFAYRAECLLSLAQVLRARADEFAALMAEEMGKPVTFGRAEVLKCAAVCDYYARNGQAMLASMPVSGSGQEAYVDFAPMGTVLAVMPWNFPFWQVLRVAAPTLMAGNTVVLKHASNVPQCALAIESAFRESAFPDNVFRTLLIGARQVEAVLDHDSVIGVSLTGSEGAGSKVASAAGARLKKCVMELGGSDPFVVLADADLDKAARVGAISRCGNAGQTCIAAKRFIVMDEVFDAFVEALSREMDKLTMGDPMAEDTVVGPMSSTGLRADLHDQVERCKAAGGKVVKGGVLPEGDGAFYPLSIIVDAPFDADVCHEELFGPVALVFRATDEDQAVAMANDTPFGLGGSVWTGDGERGLAFARRIEAGAVVVNGQVRSDPLLPFGGIKRSGFGRELSAFGIREFVNVKSVIRD